MKVLFSSLIVALALSACGLPAPRSRRAIGEPVPSATTSAEPLWSTNAPRSR